MNKEKIITSIKIIEQWHNIWNAIHHGSITFDILSWIRYNFDEDEEIDSIDELLHADLILCLLNLGHDPLFEFDKAEIIPLKYAIYKTKYKGDLSFFDYLSNNQKELIEYIKKIYYSSYVSCCVNKLRFNLADCIEDKLYTEESITILTRYYQIMQELSSAIAEIDEIVTNQEHNWIKFIKLLTNKAKEEESDFYKYDYPYEDEDWMEDEKYDEDIEKNNEETRKIDQSYGESLDDPEYESDDNTQQKTAIDELNSLIGLTKVKAEVSNLNNLLKIQKIRETRGMKVSPISYHCVFTGNPGTGKTTVARLLAQTYKELGLLTSGHLIETDRSGLVADYVGQTATKTNEIIDKALDGVLFIDEAYSLAQGGQNDYGKEAISTLLKRMEDNRDRLVVILAGYNKEMSEFISSNSGLQSRFSRYINFPDYTTDELLEIFSLILKKNDLKATDEALLKAKRILNKAVENKDEAFGNGRFVRNLFEAAITQQANRLASKKHITDEDLSTIEEEDICY